MSEATDAASTSSSSRATPNVLIVGTPGTGKTTLAGQLAERTGLKHVGIGDLAERNNFYEGFDENYQCNILDEEKVLDELEDQMTEGGNVVEYHGCDFFPERWFDAVFVLRTDNTILYDRLAARGYAEKKLRENVECEIFGTLCDEARASYKDEIIEELRSDTVEDMERNVDLISSWIDQWLREH